MKKTEKKKTAKLKKYTNRENRNKYSKKQSNKNI